MSFEKRVIKMHTEDKLAATEIAEIIGGYSRQIIRILENEGVYNPEYSKLYRSNEEIKKLIADGLSNTEIGDILGLARCTVSKRISKYNLRDGVEVKLKAINSDRHLCKKCLYRCSKRDSVLGFGCNYICVTGESRGCKAENCDKYKEGNPEKNVNRLVLDGNVNKRSA